MVSAQTLIMDGVTDQALMYAAKPRCLANGLNNQSVNTCGIKCYRPIGAYLSLSSSSEEPVSSRLESLLFAKTSGETSKAQKDIIV